ncbi:MAG: hypothetical protein JW790_06005, partial [Dehalococcoidales bacterium]|nr:hypothetical protein [Dehalococcoidales bacterium]
MRKIALKPLLLSLVLILSLLLSSGCIILPEEWFTPAPEVEEPMPTTPTTPTPTEPATPIDPYQASPEPSNGSELLPDFVAVVEKVKPSVVAIQTDVGAGSG